MLEALTAHALQGLVGANHIIRTMRDMVAVPEIKLCHAAVQMLLGAVLVHSRHAPLEDGEEAFDGVGVHVAGVAQRGFDG